MENSIRAFQGQSFSVTLQSMIGSTNHGWCLTSLPSCFVLTGQVNYPTRRGIGPVNQVFYFLTVGVPESGLTAVLKFGMYNLTQVSYPFKADRTVDIQVNIIPCNEDSATASDSPFVKYSENAAFYGDPSNEMLAALAYGYPVVKYGYPVVKYGYPVGDDCCTDDCCAGFKYGYPVPTEKYGYPIAAEKYGYPVVKYGYPTDDDCCDDDCCASLKYGFPKKK